ncbi:MAG TPA: MFS transporter [Sphingobium sp.]
MSIEAARPIVAEKGSGEFRRGWGVVLAALLGIGLGLSPMPIYTFGVFAPYLAADFGWSMGQIMSGLAVTTLVVFWAGPLAGFLAVRYGARRIALLSSLLFGLALCMLAFSNGSLPLFYGTWALIAAVGAGTLPITWTRPVNRIFDVHKGLALGISMIGSGIFGMISKPYLAWAIETYGWRGAYVALGMLPILIAFPAAFLLFREGRGGSESLRHSAASESGMTLREAVRSWRFWLLAVALVPISFALAGPMPNLEVMLRDGGLSAPDILKLTPLLGLTALIGRLMGGWLMDRFWAPAVGFVILGMPVISCWIFTAATLDFYAAGLAIILIGIALGVEFDLIAFLVARYFGMRSYPAIYGCLYVSFALGAGLAPAFFGRDHDLHGNYDFALTLSLFLLLAGAASLLFLGRYRRFDSAPAAASSSN